MKTAKCCYLLFMVLLAVRLGAQSYVFSNDIPVTVGGNVLQAAWAGGLNAPQFSEIDLDNDGRQDLVIFDRVGTRLLTFLNGGTAGQIDYNFAPQYMDLFPANLRDWVLLRDFDDDGYMDVFTAVPQVSNVRVYRNTSLLTGGTLSFTLYRDTLISVYPPTLPLYVGKSDIPAIDDVDEDGDLDIVSFHIGGQKMEWHKNLSVENTGGLLGMDFDVQSRCFGHFEEDPFTCTPLINRVPCGTGERGAQDSEEKTALHSGSTTLSLDLNADGLKDLLIGDVGCPTLYSLVNGGTLQIAHFSSSESDYPAADSSVNVTSFPASYYLDLDNDGVKDLVTAPNNTSVSEDVTGTMFHKNVGANNQPQFQFQRYGVLQEEMIEMGTGANPAFLDFNDDGLKDLIVGGIGRFDSLVGFFPIIQLYENTGTAQQPAFTQVSADYLNLRGNSQFANMTGIRPAAGDLDGDGDDDLLLGCSNGTIFHFVNAAFPGTPAAYVLASTFFGSIDVGISSAPQLVDLNNDNDLDLLVGNHRGYVRYYENTGSPSFFNFVLVEDTFGMVKINDFTGQTVSNGYAQPFATDYDDDNDMDLLVGGIDGQVQVYENITLNPGAVFIRGNDLFGKDFGLYSSPAAAVLDSARLSYVVGDYRGGLMLLRANGPVAVEAGVQGVLPEIRLWPNPASDEVYIQVMGDKSMLFNRYSVCDVMGREVLRGSLTGNEGTLDVAGLGAGMYYVVVDGKGGRVACRLMVE